MSLDWIPDWLKALGTVGGLILSSIALLISRRDRTSDGQKKAWANVQRRIESDKRVADERHTSNVRRLSDISQAVAVVSERLEHMPDKEEIGDLYKLIREIKDDLSELGSTVSDVRGTQRQVTKTVDLMQEHLMRGK